MRPVLTTRADLAAMAAERWKAQYYKNGSWYERLWRGSRTPEKIYEGLLAEPQATPDRVDEIIGTSGWTTVSCDACNSRRLDDTRKLEAVVQVGEKPDYESSTATLCEACITEAYMLFHGVDQKAALKDATYPDVRGKFQIADLEDRVRELAEERDAALAEAANLRAREKSLTDAACWGGKRDEWPSGGGTGQRRD